MWKLPIWRRGSGRKQRRKNVLLNPARLAFPITIECRAILTGQVPAMAVNFDVRSMAVRIPFAGDYFWLDQGETRTFKVNLPQGVAGVTAWNASQAG